MSKTGNVRVISLSDTVGARALENASLARAAPPERHHLERARRRFSPKSKILLEKRGRAVTGLTVRTVRPGAAAHGQVSYYKLLR